MTDTKPNMMTAPEMPKDFFDHAGRHYTTHEEGLTLRTTGRPEWLKGSFVVLQTHVYERTGVTHDFRRHVLSTSGLAQMRPAFGNKYDVRPTFFRSRDAARGELLRCASDFIHWLRVRIDLADPFRSTIIGDMYADRPKKFPFFVLADAFSYEIHGLQEIKSMYCKMDAEARKRRGEVSREGVRRARRKAEEIAAMHKAEPMKWILQDSVTERYVSIPDSGIRHSSLVADVDDSTCFDSIDTLLQVGRAFECSFYNPEFAKWRLKSVCVHVSPDGRFLRKADTPSYERAGHNWDLDKKSS